MASSTEIQNFSKQIRERRLRDRWSNLKWNDQAVDLLAQQANDMKTITTLASEAEATAHKQNREKNVANQNGKRSKMNVVLVCVCVGSYAWAHTCV